MKYRLPAIVDVMLSIVLTVSASCHVPDGRPAYEGGSRVVGCPLFLSAGVMRRVGDFP